MEEEDEEGDVLTDREKIEQRIVREIDTNIALNNVFRQGQLMFYQSEDDNAREAFLKRVVDSIMKKRGKKEFTGLLKDMEKEITDVEEGKAALEDLLKTTTNEASKQTLEADIKDWDDEVKKLKKTYSDLRKAIDQSYEAYSTDVLSAMTKLITKKARERMAFTLMKSKNTKIKDLKDKENERNKAIAEIKKRLKSKTQIEKAAAEKEAKRLEAKKQELLDYIKKIEDDKTMKNAEAVLKEARNANRLELIKLDEENEALLAELKNKRATKKKQTLEKSIVDVDTTDIELIEAEKLNKELLREKKLKRLTASNKKSQEQIAKLNQQLTGTIPPIPTRNTFNATTQPGTPPLGNNTPLSSSSSKIQYLVTTTGGGTRVEGGKKLSELLKELNQIQEYNTLKTSNNCLRVIDSLLKEKSPPLLP
jgi:DNA repair exonuclease SbcCD ATPase subunit